MTAGWQCSDSWPQSCLQACTPCSPLLWGGLVWRFHKLIEWLAEVRDVATMTEGSKDCGFVMLWPSPLFALMWLPMGACVELRAALAVLNQ